ncbi:sugar transferase [Clostridium sp. AF21-20LB]|uniref:sugar transferase n=1 Tax=unclassified Clostridium TaxID=2614128 RepID=UPI0026B1E297
MIVGISIKVTDGGPVIYHQTRLTKNGKKFQIYKFRTMVQNAEADGKARLASEDDPRILPIGRLLRATRLDELPQIYNILKGDMSIVGPRPERPELAAELEKEIPEFSFRLQVKAGLTGYAQVYGKYNTTPYDKLKLDLTYIRNYSVLEDLKLIIMTPKIMLMKESTEGVKEEQEPTNGK